MSDQHKTTGACPIPDSEAAHYWCGEAHHWRGVARVCVTPRTVMWAMALSWIIGLATGALT